jgi:4-hydroxy-3-polyprenylbenzoate decarboxylase
MKGTTMEYDDLRTWIDAAEKLGEIRHVSGASWQEDMGQIAEMVIHTFGAPAVLFDDIPGYPAGHRILVNANATPSRLALSLGLPQDLTRRELMDEFLRLTEADRRIAPKTHADGPLFDNVVKGDDVDLFDFPTPMWHPEDGGRYIGTGCAIVTRDPDSGWINLGTYRVMIHDKNHVGVYISPGKHGRQMRDKYFDRKEPFPVAIVCGMDPLIFAASTLEVPFGVSEYEWTGAIRGEAYPTVNLPITGLPVPATSEIVLEGYLHHDKMAAEGPFGEWTGYYGQLQSAEPVMEVEAVYYRNNPIMLGVPPNKPPAYDPYLYREYLRSALLMRELKGTGIPGIVDVNCFAIGGTRLFNVVSIEQKYAGHSRQTLHAAATVNSASYMGRLVVVVDDDIDVTDLDDVLWAVLTRADPERSVDIIKRALSGPLDPALEPGKKMYNSRLLIDATRPWEWRDKFATPIGPSPAIKAETRRKWGHLLAPLDAPRTDG